MVHERKQIRDKIKALLLGAATQAGSNVYTNRMLSFFESELPSLNVLTFSESSEIRNNTPQIIERNLDVHVEIRAEDNDLVDDTLDEISEEVENAIGIDFFTNNPYFNLDFIEDIYLKMTTGEVEAMDGRQQIGKQTLIYSLKYISEQPKASPLKDDIKDLERIDVDYEQSPVDQDIDAEDIIDDLQA